MSRWRTSLVTGASGGIGGELARQLAARGSDLVRVGRREGELRALAADLERTHGVHAEVLRADLADDRDLERVAAAVAGHEPAVDLLVNGAGFGTTGRFRDLDVTTELDQVAVLVTAVQRLCHAAASAMSARGYGGILNVASAVAHQPAPLWATYSASKAWVVSYTQALHLELRPAGVHATVLCPGFTRTAFQATAGMDASAVPSPLWADPATVARVGVEAVTRNQPVAVPGLLYRLHAGSLWLAPRGLLRRAAHTVASRWGS